LNILISIIVAGVLIYLLLKFCMHLYRPFYFVKLIKKTEEMYETVLSHTKRDIDSALEHSEKWHSGAKAQRTAYSEEEINERVKAAQVAKAHEEKVYSKFLRLKERYVQKRDTRGNSDYIKIADLIMTYQRYLEVRLNQMENGSLIVNALTSGAISFEEFEASRNDTLIILEENERKLDRLLSE